MTITAKVVADSVGPNGVRITTMELEYPRFIHAEFMTHRVFSRNASSSRAIPVMKVLKRIFTDMAMPVHWGANMPGMQAREELSGWRLKMARALWIFSGWIMCCFAYLLTKIGLHKQVANRIIEPWSHIKVLVTSTYWDNFFALRLHQDAQPEILELAEAMFLAKKYSDPVYLHAGEWHLPYIRGMDRSVYSVEDRIKMSVARCARVSFLNHDGRVTSLEEDLKLFDRLLAGDLKHASPAEHQAQAIDGYSQVKSDVTGNFYGWKQYRKNIEHEAIMEA